MQKFNNLLIMKNKLNNSNNNKINNNKIMSL